MELLSGDPPADSRRRNALRTATENVWLAVRHPEFAAVESLYVARFIAPHLAAEVPRINHAELDCWERRLRDIGARDATLWQLIEIVGPDVLVPTYPRWEPGMDKSGARARIRELIWNRIRDCYEAARWGSLEERRAAAAFFKGFGGALAGERRGKRKRAVADRSAVREFHYRHCFRLRIARKLMSLRVDCRSREDKLSAIADACGIPIAQFREHLLATTDEPKRPISIQNQARIWTAARFGITESQISNILAVKGRRRSAKTV